MPPGVLLGVVNRAVSPAALRTRKPRTLGEVNPQIEPPALGVELNTDHLPRLLEAERSLKQVHIVHAGLQSSNNRSRHALSRTRRTHSDQRGAGNRRDRSPARPRGSHRQGVSLRSNRREGTGGQGALSRSVPRLRGAHRATETARATPTRIANAAIPARSRRNGPGNGFAKRCAHGERATALRRPRMTGRARTHAGAAAKRSHDYKPKHGPHRPPSPICTGPGRRPAPTPSTAPERLRVSCR